MSLPRGVYPILSKRGRRVLHDQSQPCAVVACSCNYTLLSNSPSPSLFFAHSYITTTTMKLALTAHCKGTQYQNASVTVDTQIYDAVQLSAL